MTWCAIVPEPGYGVYAGSLTNAMYPTLVGGNSFTMRKVPIRQIIRTADGGNRRKFVVGSRRQYQGTLNTLLHPDQSVFWATACQSVGLGLATGQATIAGGAVTGVTLGGVGYGYPTSSTIPVSFFGGGGTGAYGFATASSGAVTSVTMTGGSGGTGYTSPPGVQIGGMPSYTILYWDGVQFWEFLGACLQGLSVTATAAQDYLSISSTWIAQHRPDTQITTPAWPAASVYSRYNPYLFIESARLVTLTTENTGTPVTMPLTAYKQMSFNLQNVLQGTWDEQAYITSCLYCGRDMDFSIQPQYLGQAWPVTSTTAPVFQTFRKSFEDQLPMTWSLQFSRAANVALGQAAHTLTINAQSNSYISNIQDDIPLDNASYQMCTVQAFIDSTTTQGYDFQITGT